MVSRKWASILVGVLVETNLVLAMRYSKIVHDSQTAYLNSVVVAAAEAFKICLSCALEVSARSKCFSSGTQDQPAILVLQGMALGLSSLESFKLIVPAILYLVQNNLLFVALSNLSVPVYIITIQGKLLTTALISRVMLNKRITTMQYFAITLLGIGVATVNIGNASSTPSSDRGKKQDQTTGLIAVLISCVTSGFAGVYFEALLKSNKNDKSLHCRNFQLASWSFILAGLGMLCSSNDRKTIHDHGVFYAFDKIVMVVVVCQAINGFSASLILHYADAILMKFSAGFSAVLSTVLSVLLFDAKINISFFLGSIVIAIAVSVYTFSEQDKVVSTKKLLGLLNGKNKLRKATTIALVLGATCPLIFGSLKPFLDHLERIAGIAFFRNWGGHLPLSRQNLSVTYT